MIPESWVQIPVTLFGAMTERKGASLINEGLAVMLSGVRILFASYV